jgi:hypothetical protein
MVGGLDRIAGSELDETELPGGSRRLIEVERPLEEGHGLSIVALPAEVVTLGDERFNLCGIRMGNARSRAGHHAEENDSNDQCA